MCWKKEIKFRGRRANKQWVYGLIVKDSKGDYYIQTEELKRFKICPETIGQLVLKTPQDLDKFGKSGNYEDFFEVYEGDILEARCKNQYVDGYKGYSVNLGEKFVVECCESGYTLVPLDMWASWVKFGRVFSSCRTMSNWQLWNNHRFYIPVGNIYDNNTPRAKNYFM